MGANWAVSDKKKAREEGLKRKKYWTTSIDQIVDEWEEKQDLKFLRLRNFGHKGIDFILYNSNVYTKNPYLMTPDGYQYPVIIDRFQLVVHMTPQEEMREQFKDLFNEEKDDQKALKEMLTKIDGYSKSLRFENWLSAEEMKKLLFEMQIIMNDADAYKILDILCGL